MEHFPKNDVLYFARLNFRHLDTPFGIRQADRLFHSYIIGKTGTGKSSLLQTKMMQDANAGRGFCLLDPHGDLVANVIAFIPYYRRQDVIYIDLADPMQPYLYNPLRNVPYEKRSLVAANIIEIFKKLWGDSKGWGVKLEHIMRFTLLSLLDCPTAYLSDISKMLHDKSFRAQVLQYVVNEDVKAFWIKEFPRYMYNDVLPVLNKIGALVAYPPIKRLVIENKKEVSLRQIMDGQKILLVNLSKGAVGEDVSQIVGSLLLTSLSTAAFSRIDTPEEKRLPFFVYLDEFQSYTSMSLVNMLSELRKFKIGMILAHQYMKQLEPEILHAVLGNVGTHISFRLDLDDASIMAKKMYPIFEISDYLNLANYDIYLTLMIDGTPSKPFSATTLSLSDNFFPLSA